jgi:hypothetical protein
LVGLPEIVAHIGAAEISSKYLAEIDDAHNGAVLLEADEAAAGILAIAAEQILPILDDIDRWLNPRVMEFSASEVEGDEFLGIFVAGLA